MTVIRKTERSEFMDFHTDYNNVSVGFNDSDVFLVKIHQPSSSGKDVVIHSFELQDLIELLQVVQEEFSDRGNK